MTRIPIAACLLLSTTLLSAADNPAPARQELNRLAPEAAEPPAPGIAGPVAPPEDIAEAGKLFGNPAQLADLGRRQPDPKSAFSFAVIGDSEEGRFFFQRWWSPGRDAFERQLKSVTGRGADFVMQLGDFVSKGTEKNYRRHVEFLKQNLRVPLLHVIGNHDRSKPNGEADKSLYKALFGETDFYFDYNGWRLVAFDSADYRVTDAQLDWLDRTLDTPQRKLLFLHIPPIYLHGRIISKKPAEPQGVLKPEGYFTQGAERFREIVKKRRVERVYFGHIHAYGTAMVDGVGYVLTAGGGSPLYPLPPGYPQLKPAHYIWVEIGPKGLTETVHTMDGETFPVVF